MKIKNILEYFGIFYFSHGIFKIKYLFDFEMFNLPWYYGSFKNTLLIKWINGLIHSLWLGWLSSTG